MTRFTYEALDGAGRVEKGETEAVDRRAAARRIAARGLRLSKITEAGAAKKVAPGAVGDPEDHPSLHRRRAFGVHPVASAFMDGFGELHEGGMPVGDAVKLMAQRVAEPALRALSKGLWRELSEGRNLSAALAKRPALFDEAAVRLVEAGEATGNVVDVVNRVRSAYTRKEALRARILKATAYPATLCVVAVFVLVLFVFVIMPIFEKLMAQMHGEFPWYAKMMMMGAKFFVLGLPLILIVAGVLAWRLKKARASAESCRRQDAFFLKIPLIGKVLLHIEAARLSDLLATLLGSGVNAAQALRLAERPVANTELRARFMEARRRVHDGAAISSSLGDTAIFRPQDIDLASVGESSGTLPRAFGAIGAKQAAALDAAIDRLVVVISGVFMTLVVAMIGFSMISIITTMLSAVKSISRH